MDFPGIYLIKELHHDKGVEDNGVVFRRGGVERSITTTVNIKDLLTYIGENNYNCKNEVI